MTDHPSDIQTPDDVAAWTVPPICELCHGPLTDPGDIATYAHYECARSAMPDDHNPPEDDEP